MNKLNEKLANFSVEKLEERKEFTFYCMPNPCNPKPPCGPTTPPSNPGQGGGGN
jgi:hypothetical protein